MRPPNEILNTINDVANITVQNIEEDNHAELLVCIS